MRWDAPTPWAERTVRACSSNTVTVVCGGVVHVAAMSSKDVQHRVDLVVRHTSPVSEVVGHAHAHTGTCRLSYSTRMGMFYVVCEGRGAGQRAFSSEDRVVEGPRS